MKHKKTFAILATCVFIAGVLGLAGCAGQDKETENPDNATSVIKETPSVFVDDDGDLIQLSPYDDRTNAAWYQQDPFKSYNLNFLHAEQRGCKACHSDLADLVYNCGYYHPGRNGLDVEWSVQTCQGCHSTSGYGIDITEDNRFGDIIHGTHINVDGIQCWNCHASGTSNLIYDYQYEGKMQLWEDARISELRGFTDIPADDFDGTFSYNQDLIMDAEDMPTIAVQFYEYD